MASFYINTNRVNSVSDNIETLANKCQRILEDVESYDVTCEGGFDFSGARNAIANNLKGVSTKLSNTVALLTAVIKMHGGIQNSVSGSSTSSGSMPSYSSTSTSYSGFASSVASYSSGSSSGGSTTTSSDTANISAMDRLRAALTDTAATKAIAVPTLLKVDDVLKKIDVKEISPMDIEKETKGRNTLVVEGISSSSECAEYLQTVSEVTSKYDIYQATRAYEAFFRNA